MAPIVARHPIDAAMNTHSNPDHCFGNELLPTTTEIYASRATAEEMQALSPQMLHALKSAPGMPDYLRDHAVYYAGPAKTPAGYASGSFGPTTAGRMDAYVDEFQRAGGSLVMVAKGNRSPAVTKACQDNGGFYLGSIGGPAARLAQECITSVETLEYAELGMEAVWKIEVVDFPAFIVVDDKGNDFFADTLRPVATTIPVGAPD